MNEPLYTTKVVVEVEISHYQTSVPHRIIQSIVVDRLKCPAVNDIKVLEAQSNYVLHAPPANEFKAVEIKP